MTPQDSTPAALAANFCSRLLRDDSVRLFDPGRTLFGAMITVGLGLAAHFWL